MKHELTRALGQHHLWLKLCVLVFAALLSVAVFFEYKTNQNLLVENESLLSARIQALVKDTIEQHKAQYPASRDAIKKQWASLPKRFMLVENGPELGRLYPSMLSSNSANQGAGQENNEADKQTATQIWQAYFSYKYPRLPFDANQRVNIVSAIRQAIEQEDTNKINDYSRAFLQHLQLYQLSDAEELMSRLAFVQANTQSRWNDALIELLLIKGKANLLPASYYLYAGNHQLNQSEFETAESMLHSSVEQSTLSLAPLTELKSAWSFATEYSLSKALKNSSFQHAYIDISQNQETVLVYSSPLFMQDTILVLPFDVKALLLEIGESLKALALFEMGDNISLRQNFPMPLDNLALQINKQSWQSQAQNLYFMLLVKGFVVVLFTLLILSLLSYYQRKQWQKESDLAERERFIHFVSHELKTPLASIRLMSETMEKRQQAQLSLKDYPSRIVNETDRLDKMVDNILSLQALKQRQTNLEKHSVKLHQLIEQEYKLATEKTTISFHLANSVSPSQMVMSNASLLALVIRNVFDNAIKYRSEKALEVSCRFLEQGSILEIQDNGVGINKQQQTQLFNAFYQGQSKQKGFGIGLALCKTIMQELDGDIRVAKTKTKTESEIHAKDGHVFSGTVWHVHF